MHLTTLALILPACMARPEPAHLVPGPQSIAQIASIIPGPLKDGLQSSNPGPILSGPRFGTGLQSVPRVPVVAPRSTALIAGEQPRSGFAPSIAAIYTGTATVLLSATDGVFTIFPKVANILGAPLNVTFTAASLLPFTNVLGTSERAACNFSGTYIPPASPSPTSASIIRTGFRLDSNFTPTTSYPASSGAMAYPQIQCSGL